MKSDILDFIQKFNKENTDGKVTVNNKPVNFKEAEAAIDASTGFTTVRLMSKKEVATITMADLVLLTISNT